MKHFYKKLVHVSLVPLYYISCTSLKKQSTDENKYFLKQPRTDHGETISPTSLDLTADERKKLAAMVLSGDGGAANRLSLFHMFILADRPGALAWLRWAMDLRYPNAKANFKSIAEIIKS